MNAPITIEQLLYQYWAAKEQADQANAALADVQAAITALVDKKEEGTTNLEIGDCKVSITGKLNRKVNTDSLKQAWADLSESAQRCFVWKADVALKDLRAAETMNAEAYAEAAKHITTTPAKPALKIERI